MYFGINIRKNMKFDVNDVAARLFICPRISPDHATKMLNMLVNGKFSIESFIDNSGCIEFLGYTPETEALLEQERQEVIIAHQAWQEKQYLAI